MSLDLKKLADKLDESLNNETTESLTDWLGEKTMSNNKQSSVDWLITELNRIQELYYGQSIIPIEVITKAKAMHKEEMIKNCAKMQIIDDVDFDGNVTFIFDPEKNYNETFGE